MIPDALHSSKAPIRIDIKALTWVGCTHSAAGQDAPPQCITCLPVRNSAATCAWASIQPSGPYRQGIGRHTQDMPGNKSWHDAQCVRP